MKTTTFSGLSLAISMALTLACSGASLAEEPAATSSFDTASAVHTAKSRLEKAKVRRDIAKKQLAAAKARLKAAEAEFKAAKSNHQAKTLNHKAFKLAEDSGLPAITDSMIKENRTRSLASKLTLRQLAEKKKGKNATPASVDLSKTRIKKVDFNAQPMEKPSPAKAPSTSLSKAIPPGLVATSGSAMEQPPIVP